MREKRTLHSFYGQAFRIWLTSVVRWDCCPLSLMNEATGRRGYQANSSGFQNRFDRFCTGTWLAFLCITAGSLLALLTPLVLKWLIDQIIPQRKMGLLLLAVGLIFLGYQGRMALTSLGNYLMLTAAQKIGLTLRMRLLGRPRYALGRIFRGHACG